MRALYFTFFKHRYNVTGFYYLWVHIMGKKVNNLVN